MKIKCKDSVVTKNYGLYWGDSCEALPGIPSETVGMAAYSPPFASLYSYSDSDRDLGNCRSYEEFFEHYGFIVSELERVLMPGRIVAVHCMDLPTQKGKEGYIGLRDFPGDLIRCHVERGFTYHSHHCIWKDPLVAATRTKALGLAHKQIAKDSTRCRMGIADYVLAFRKVGDNPEPVKHPEGLTEYCGKRKVPRDLDLKFGGINPFTLEPWNPRENKRSHWIWQQYASPVWDDVDQSDVLPYRGGRDPEDQKHVCPLQLGVIERCLILWSNPGDVVCSPFAGVGSEIYVAAKLGRKGIGIELKRSYWRQSVKNLESLKLRQKANAGFHQ